MKPQKKETKKKVERFLNGSYLKNLISCGRLVGHNNLGTQVNAWYNIPVAWAVMRGNFYDRSVFRDGSKFEDLMTNVNQRWLISEPPGVILSSLTERIDLIKPTFADQHNPVFRGRLIERSITALSIFSARLFFRVIFATTRCQQNISKWTLQPHSILQLHSILQPTIQSPRVFILTSLSHRSQFFSVFLYSCLSRWRVL